MKKIFNRVLAAAIAVPMVLTQGVVANVNAADTGAKSITVTDFTRIAPDKTESQWNELVYLAAGSMDGTSKAVSAEAMLNLIPQTNIYGVLMKELLSDATAPVMSVQGGIVTVKCSVDMSDFAEKHIYSRVRESSGVDFEMTAFNKTIEFEVAVDANVLATGKTINAMPTAFIDGTEIDETNAVAYFQGLKNQLDAEILAQVDAMDAEVEYDAEVELIAKLQRAVEKYENAKKLVRSGSYATADEMMAAISKFGENRTEVYTFPASVDEAVARHGNGFNAAVQLISDITASSGYLVEVTADEVAAVAKTGSNFEVTVSGGTYNVTFDIPDDEAAEVEAYVNKNATPDENGVTEVYKSSNKTVEFEFTMAGDVYYNVTRNIEYIDSALTTTTTTTTTTDSTTTTTTTTGSDDTTTTTTTTTTGTGSDVTTTSTTTTTGTGSDDTTTTTTTTTLPAEFELATVELEAGVGYYFSHDENAFDLSELISNLTLVGTLDGEAYSVAIAASDYATYLTPAFATPADYFNSVEGTAYVANELALTFAPTETLKVAADADLTVDGPTVYIGVKGDTDLNGAVEINDAQMVLDFYAQGVAQMDVTPLNEDANLAVLAYFLADVDTESKAGADTEEAILEVADARNIIAYYAQTGAFLEPTWDAIIGA